MRKQYLIPKAILFSLLLCLVCSELAVAQGPRGPRGGMRRDPLAGLKSALSDAGAPALSAAQEQQLNALITAQRSAQPEGPSAALQAASQAYDTAVLNGSLSAAQAQADLIATEMAALTRTRLKETAQFEIDVLNVLRSNASQFNQLSAHLGNVGMSRLLRSLAGGFGGPPGRIGMDDGRMRARPE